MGLIVPDADLVVSGLCLHLCSLFYMLMYVSMYTCVGGLDVWIYVYVWMCCMDVLDV